nr:hypothetical protein [Bacteroides bouchesdurhonensis]
MKQKLLADIELDVQELKCLMKSFSQEPNSTLTELLKRNILQMQGRLEQLLQELDSDRETPLTSIATEKTEKSFVPVIEHSDVKEDVSITKNALVEESPVIKETVKEITTTLTEEVTVTETRNEELPVVKEFFVVERPRIKEQTQVKVAGQSQITEQSQKTGQIEVIEPSQVAERPQTAEQSYVDEQPQIAKELPKTEESHKAAESSIETESLTEEELSVQEAPVTESVLIYEKVEERAQIIMEEQSNIPVLKDEIKTSVLGESIKISKGLRSSISLNDSFRFSRELFDGDSSLMNRVIEQISVMSSYKAAMAFLSSKVTINEENEAHHDFLELLKKYFNQSA